ncbi:MAG: antitoxin family protein [Planctomycetes bacterium]|nr:antitoxin family protein [Planctomycetota bacterium]
MPITIEAIYEDGVFKPAQSLDLKDRQRVRITVHPDRSPLVEAAGIMGWKGDPKVVEHFALDPEFDPQEDS